MKKLTIAAALLLILTLSLAACNSYRSDVAVNDLVTPVLEAVSTQGGFLAADADYVSLEFENPATIDSNVSEWMICASSSPITVDEFGIFRVKDGGDVDAITASTITSRAYVNGLALACQVFHAIAGTPMPLDSWTGASVDATVIPSEVEESNKKEE